MIIDGVVLLATLLFALLAYWRGLLRKLAGIAAILIACVAVAFGGKELASLVAGQWELDPAAIYIPVCIAGWLLVFILCRLTFGFLARKLGSAEDGKPRPWNRKLGALFGAIEGLALCWFVVGVMDCIPEDRRAQHAPGLHEQMKASFFTQLTHATNPAAYLELQPLISDLAVLSQYPQLLNQLEEDEDVQELLQHEKVKAILEDEALVEEWQEGHYPYVLADRKVREALEDPEVRGALRRVPLRDAVHRLAEEARQREEAESGDEPGEDEEAESQP
ncbi:MAG: CvpA family protein [Candidatus Brocadiia bacterium]